MTDTPYSLYNRKGIHDIAVNPFYYLMFIYGGKGLDLLLCNLCCLLVGIIKNVLLVGLHALVLFL